MLANGVRQTTTTVGPGDLTLVAVPGMPTVADVAPIGRLHAYSLVDESGHLIETGIGYLSALTTFVRALVCAAYSGGVYSSVAPTAVALSGTTTLILGPHASTMETLAPTVDAHTAGINRMVTTAHRTGSVTSQAVASFRLHYVPFLLRIGGVVNTLSINVGTAAAAGKVARLGLYACNAKGYPGQLAVSTNDFAVDSTGMKINSVVAPTFLPAGWYFAASVSDGTPTIFMHSASNVAVGGSPLGFSGTAAVDFRYEGVVSTVLPDTANPTTTAVLGGSQHLPMVYVGF